MEIKVDETYTFKLNSGEELVAKVLAVHTEYLTISDPVSIGRIVTGKQIGRAHV